KQLESRMIVAELIASVTPEQRQAWLNEVARVDSELNMAIVAAQEAGAAEIPQWQTFKADWAQWVQLRDQQLLTAAELGDRVLYQQIRRDESQPLVDQITTSLAEAKKAIHTYTEELAADAAAKAGQSIIIVTITLAAGLAVVVALGLWLA